MNRVAIQRIRHDLEERARATDIADMDVVDVLIAAASIVEALEVVGDAIVEAVREGRR